MSHVEQFDKEDEYGFHYDGSQIVNDSGEGKESGIATGYLELDLTDKKGKYTLTVNAEISTRSGNGYVSITNKPDNSENIRSAIYGNLITLSSSKTTEQNTIDIAGGKKYYLNFRYKKGSSTSSGYEEKLKINNITLTKKQEGKLTLTSGIIEVDKVGTSKKYYSAIENEGVANIEGGKIIGTQKYIAGITTLSGGTSNISEGEIALTGSSDIAIKAAKKGGITNVTGGNIHGYYGIRTEECLADAIIKGGTFNKDCNYQICNDGIYSLIMLKNVTLNKANNGNCVYVGEEYSDTIIDECNINSEKTRYIL